MADMKDILLKYINNSPFCDDRNWLGMSISDILDALDAVVDKEKAAVGRSYRVVKIDTYNDALQFKDYAPDWSIIASEADFYEHLCGGRNQFYFCVRDDIQRYPQKCFGKDFPYDNYGLSLIAVCVNGWGELFSVTSRWNYEEAFDNYLTKEQLVNILDTDFEKTFCPDRIRTILHLSDTHGAHRRLVDLPEADLIVHSGDVGMAGTEKEIMDFLNWFLDLPYRYKIFVPGNHDHCLLDANSIEGMDGNCFFLSNSGVVIEGLKIYGVPCFVEHSIRGETNRLMSKIPFDTDILVTHQPPAEILDKAGKRRYGSQSLLKRIAEVKPKLHLFGHIHDSYGHCEIDGTTYCNSALMDERYHLVNPPQLITLPLEQP